MAASDALHGTELTKPRKIRVKQPDSRRTGHGKHRSLRLANHKFSGPGIHTHSSDTLFPGLVKKQGRRLGPITDTDTKPLHLLYQSRLKRGSPDTERKFILVIIGKHEAGLLIPELRALKLALRIADLSTERLQIQETVVTLPALNIMGDTVAVPVLLPDVSVSDLLRRHLGARIRTGRFPVVKTSSRRATFLRRALLHNDNRKPLPSRRNRCKTPRKAAAQHQHITPDDLLLTHLIPVRPVVFSVFHIAFSLLLSNIFHRHLLFKESYPHLPQNYHFPQPKLPGFAIQPRAPVSNQVFMWRRGRNSWFAPPQLKPDWEPARGASSKPFLLYISSARQQAAKCPGATSRRGIAPFRHSSVANGHLTANRHPGFGFTGLVTSPCRSSLFL